MAILRSVSRLTPGRISTLDFAGSPAEIPSFATHGGELQGRLYRGTAPKKASEDE
jgi:hypothetical protein